ncbi:MAG TPA: PEP-CTERM sorting domain-containing protein [Fimbriiglobus sp.]|nr:PEP-CTERM sorting domain-containing protein [Fimbriiglobus sp.]
MHLSARLLKLIPTTAVGVAAFTLTTQTASAFFPPITVPGSSGPVTVSPPPPPPVIIPVTPDVPVPPLTPPPVVPPVPPPPFVPPPPPPVDIPDPPVPPTPPQTVPEPATIVSGLIGLTALGGYTWTRRKKGGPVTKYPNHALSKTSSSCDSAFSPKGWEFSAQGAALVMRPTASQP